MVQAKDISTWPGPTKFTMVRRDEGGRTREETPCTLPVLGRFNILNALAAASACFALEVPGVKISEGLAQFSAAPMRFEVTPLKNEIIVVNDSYNANPGSMRSSLEAFVESFSNKRLCAVLGDMLELGEISGHEHQELGKFLGGFAFAKVILFGPQSRFILEGAKSALVNESNLVHCADKGALLRTVEEALKPGTAVLFKASRGMHLEETIKKILDRYS